MVIQNLDISMSTNIINPIEKRRYYSIRCFSSKVLSLVFIVGAISGSKMNFCALMLWNKWSKYEKLEF